jgi:hypothetical protein
LSAITIPACLQKQTTGIRLEEKVGPASLEGNTIETRIIVEDQRREAGKNTNPVPKP